MSVGIKLEKLTQVILEDTLGDTDYPPFFDSTFYSLMFRAERRTVLSRLTPSFK